MLHQSCNRYLSCFTGEKVGGGGGGGVQISSEVRNLVALPMRKL